ncbi:hypothetical protein F6W96_17585 [Nocardia terpenica]|uniref:Low molecular weight antigen MTB12-like C-terminal domain-containing protein n=2 Tax=Nocardia terpenica TaxID=455432 RepID=A0A6G9ZFP6_9NOCA|nr:hypothetical protein F6W96_17585 [Nocardia terpenica]
MVAGLLPRSNAARTVRVSVATAFAALAVTGMTACGTDKSASSASSTTATSASAHTGGSHAAPSVEALQATLDGFVDPAEPTDRKAKLVVDGEKRTANIDTMTQGLANYGKIGFAVSDVKAEGDTATAQVVINSPHGPAPAMPMTWQHTTAGWQLSDASACTILAMGKAPCQA